MIWVWFRRFWRWLARMVMFMPPEGYRRRIPDKGLCPVCGWMENRLRAVAKLSNVNKPAITCEHTCLRCGARWYQAPLDDAVSTATVYPCVPRSPVEERADAQEILRARAS